MKTYLDRNVVVRTPDGDFKQIVRHITERDQIATVRYQKGVQHVRCSGRPQDKNALWLVVS